MARLAEIKNVAGVKEATGSVDQAIDVIRLCGDRLAVYSGEDSLTFSLMALGGKGVISTVANVAPKETAQLDGSLLERQIGTRGASMQFKLIPLIRSLFIETNPIPGQNRALAHGQVQRRTAFAADADGGRQFEKTTTAAIGEFGLLKTRWRWELSFAASAGAWAARWSARRSSPLTFELVCGDR